MTRDARRRRLAGGYGLGAVSCAGVAATGGTALWLLWPAVSLALVGLHYLGFGPAGFQKSDGRLAPGSRLLLAPYLVAAWLNSRLWTRHRPAPDAIADGVWLGCMPAAEDMRRGGFRGLVDLSAEMPAPAGDWAYAGVPQLDLTPLAPAALQAAAAAIERLRTHGPLLVCCALGYARSASAVAAWLIASGRAADADAAIARVAACRPIVIDAAQRAALVAFSHGIPLR
jgi:protein-tyrosine phosphatase